MGEHSYSGSFVYSRRAKVKVLHRWTFVSFQRHSDLFLNLRFRMRLRMRLRNPVMAGFTSLMSLADMAIPGSALEHTEKRNGTSKRL